MSESTAMDPVSSPLETIILSYRGISSLTAVSHIWTWIAILTAAISLWRIKALAIDPSRRKIQPPLSESVAEINQQNGHPPPSPKSASNAALSGESESRCETEAIGLDFVQEWREEEERQRGYRTKNQTGIVLEGRGNDYVIVSEMKRFGCVLCNEGSKKFAVYFDGDKTEMIVKGFSFPAIEDRDYGNVVICRLLPLTGRSMQWSWYSHQDMAILNGNVVRLWDGVTGGSAPVGWSSVPVM